MRLSILVSRNMLPVTTRDTDFQVSVLSLNKYTLQTSSRLYAIASSRKLKTEAR